MKDDDTGLGAVITGLSLIGLTISAIGNVASASPDAEEERRRLERMHAEARGTGKRPTSAAPAGWYEDGTSGWRWWNGDAWTEHVRFYRPPASPVAGWYPDREGRRRRWNGQSWTAHVLHDEPQVSAPPGWYPDDKGQNRWWNGHVWTEHVHPQGLPAPEPAGPSPISSAMASPSEDDVRQGPRGVRLSSTEWQSQMRSMLLGHTFDERQWALLVGAHIDDADEELARWQGELGKLSPQQASALINRRR